MNFITPHSSPPTSLTVTPSLSSQDINRVIHAYQELAQHLDYNSLGVVLELIGELKLQSPTTSWEAFFAHYHPSSEKILNTYHGGTTAMIAAVAQQELAKQGFKIEIGAESRPTRAFDFPQPFQTSYQQPTVWKTAKELGKGYTLFFNLLRYVGETNQEQLTILQQTFMPRKELATSFDSTQIFEEKFKQLNMKPCISIESVIPFIKGAIQAGFILQILQHHTRDLFKLNLLEGTVSVTSKQSSLFLNLQTDKLCFSVENEEIESFLDQVQKTFNQPSDFKENILFLLRNREQYVKSIMASPAFALFKLWPLYSATMLIREKAHFIDSKQNAERADNKHVLEQAEESYRKALEAMYKNEIEEAHNLFEKAEIDYQKMMESGAASVAVPLSLLLEEFVSPL